MKCVSLECGFVLLVYAVGVIGVIYFTGTHWAMENSVLVDHVILVAIYHGLVSMLASDGLPMVVGDIEDGHQTKDTSEQGQKAMSPGFFVPFNLSD